MRHTAIIILAAALAACSGLCLVQGQNTQATRPVLCMARHTGPANDPRAVPPQRWDDIFWENDRIAHRIYGPAVSRPAPQGEGLVTSGIDVWVKKVRTPFMDEQLAAGAQHDDTLGKGRDCYDVQQTCGAGGLGIWDETARRLMRSHNWADKGGFINGPDVASFWVTYDPWDAGGGRKVKEKRTFTLPAGTNFTRMVSQIDDVSTPVNNGDLLVGIGIAKRRIDGTRFRGGDKFVADREKGFLCYWEPDQTYRNVYAGHTGVAVLVDPRSLVRIVEDDPTQFLAIVRVTPGKPWVYYAGACWSLGLDFKTQEEWLKYVSEYKPDFDPTK